MEYAVPSVEVMTWKLLPGFIAPTIGLEQLNVLALVRELKEKSMAMIVNITVISESLNY